MGREGMGLEEGMVEGMTSREKVEKAVEMAVAG